MSEIESRVARVQHNDRLLNGVIESNDRLAELPALLEDAWPQLQELMSYYYAHWLSDYEALDNHPQGMYGVLSEDAVFNEMGRFYDAMTTLREVVGTIIDEYEEGPSADE